MVALVVVTVVVLLLVARSWKSVAPEAIAVSGPAADDLGRGVPDHGQTGAGEALRQGRLPGLDDMRTETDAHSQQVEDALAAIE